MSSSLNYSPVKDDGVRLPDPLKFVLRNKFKNDAGVIDWVVTLNDIEYLEGVAACGVEGASELIKALEKFEMLHLFESF